MPSIIDILNFFYFNCKLISLFDIPDIREIIWFNGSTLN